MSGNNIPPPNSFCNPNAPRISFNFGGVQQSSNNLNTSQPINPNLNAGTNNSGL